MFNTNLIKTPCYVIDEAKLIKNLEILKTVQDRTDCKILLAQKAFSNFNFYPLIGKYLAGTTASGINEAMLCHNYMPYAENHIFAPAFTEKDMAEIVKICDHIVFNSFSQWDMHKNTVQNSGRNIECGIRINPEYSEIETIKEEKEIKVNEINESNNSRKDELSEKLSKLSKEQQEALLKLLER